MCPDETPSVDIDAVTGVVRLRLSRQAWIEIEIGIAGADVQVQVPVPKPKARMIGWHRQEVGDLQMLDIRIHQVEAKK